MKRKKLLAMLMAVTMVLSLVGCGAKKEEPAAVTPAANAELSGKLVVWSYDVAAKSLQDSAAAFTKLHPKVEITVEDLGTDQVYDKLTTGLASNAGLPDMASIEGERLGAYVAKFPKGFVDFTSEMNPKDFIPVKISECTVNGKIMAYPWDGAPCGLFYRTDLFEKAGIKAEDIKTWDDFIAAGMKMKAIGVKMLPVAVSKSDTAYRLILNQLGGFYFDKDGNTQLNSEASVTAMTYVKKMYEAGITFDNTNWDGLVTATKEGKIATVANGVWWAGTLQDECKEASGKWAVMRLPAVTAGGVTAAVNGGSDIVVPASSPNKVVAVEFAKFAMTDTATLIGSFSKYGIYPSYNPCYADPTFDADVPYFGGQKIWKLFAEVGKEIPNLNYTENFAETYSFVVDAQAKVTLKKADVKATMDELQKNVVSRFGK